MIFVLITRNSINAHSICKEGRDAVTPAIFLQKKCAFADLTMNS